MFNNLLDSSQKHLNAMDVNALSDLGLDRDLKSYFLVGQYPPLLQMNEYVGDEGMLDVKLS